MPAKLPPGKPTELQAALWSVKSDESLAVIHKLSYNTACQPAEEKFRKVGGRARRARCRDGRCVGRALWAGRPLCEQRWQRMLCEPMAAGDWRTWWTLAPRPQVKLNNSKIRATLVDVEVGAG